MFPISDSIRSHKFPLLNILIISVTVVVFIFQIISQNPDAFIFKYALIPSNINFGNLQTLTPFVTAIFLHGGFLHIVSNMWFLWVFGDNVEGRLGFFLFSAFYFLSGVMGNFLQYILMPASLVPMLGASGAIAGILGAYFVFFPQSKIKTFVPLFGFFTVLEFNATFMLGYWFVLQVVSGAATLPFSSETGGVAFFAHIGGFLTGFFLARIFKKFTD